MLSLIHIFAVTHHGSDGKTLDIACPLLAVTVADIVDGTFVVLLKNVGIKYILCLLYTSTGKLPGWLPTSWWHTRESYTSPAGWWLSEYLHNRYR